MTDAEIMAGILEQIKNACELVKLLEPEHRHEAIHEINMIALQLDEELVCKTLLHRSIECCNMASPTEKPKRG